MVHSSFFDMADPLAHGGILLDLPFDSDFQTPLSDDELASLSAPTSPESLLDEPLSAELFTGSLAARAALDAKGDAIQWNTILSGMPEVPSAEKLRAGANPGAADGTVMWNVPAAYGTASNVPAACGEAASLAALFGAPSPVPSDSDLDFHSFIAEECLSSDEEILIADGEVLSAAAPPCGAGHKRRRAGPHDAAAAEAAAAAQVQAKKAKLAALRQLPAHIAADTPEGKRHTHNVLERKRREDLKISYQNLRLQVPELVQVERAPTGQILVKAAEYIAQLKAEDERVMAQLRALRMQNANLRRMHASA